MGDLPLIFDTDANFNRNRFTWSEDSTRLENNGFPVVRNYHLTGIQTALRSLHPEHR